MWKVSATSVSNTFHFSSVFKQRDKKTKNRICLIRLLKVGTFQKCFICKKKKNISRMIFFFNLFVSKQKTTFFREPSSAQDGVRGAFHAAKPRHPGVVMVPGSRAGVHRDHCRHNDPTFSRPKSTRKDPRSSYGRCSCGCGASTPGCWVWSHHG